MAGPAPAPARRLQHPAGPALPLSRVQGQHLALAREHRHASRAQRALSQGWPLCRLRHGVFLRRRGRLRLPVVEAGQAQGQRARQEGGSAHHPLPAAARGRNRGSVCGPVGGHLPSPTGPWPRNMPSNGCCGSWSTPCARCSTSTSRFPSRPASTASTP